MVDHEVQLEVTYNGLTVTTDADNLVLDPTNLAAGGVLVDAKFSNTYDLSTVSPGTLRSKLTQNQRTVWDWIRNAQTTNNCANLTIVPKGPNATLLLGQALVNLPLPTQFIVNLTLELHVSDGQNGIVTKTY